MSLTVLAPASLIVFGTERTFFPVADRADSICTNAGAHKHLLHCIGSTVAERQIVIDRTAFVAVTFNKNFDVRVGLKKLDIVVDRGLLICNDYETVEIKKDILNIPMEGFRFVFPVCATGGGGGRVTVTRADAFAVPPRPFAIN